MVKIVKKKGKTFYACEACSFAHEEKMWAKKCEDFCTEHSSCSLEITSHAVARVRVGFHGKPSLSSVKQFKVSFNC